MTPRQLVALLAGKTVYFALHAAGRGGSALPGLIAERIDPSLLQWYAKQCSKGVIIICGTNGKTTTARLLSDILQTQVGSIVQNRTGSNMVRGHLSAFLSKPAASLAILEVDEAVLPIILRYIDPQCVVLHNLFRDQLDRYGEVDSTARKWLDALNVNLTKSATLLINGDDPNLAHIGYSLAHPKTIYYGLNDPSVAEATPLATVDAYLSPVSGQPLHYRHYYLSHLGEYTDNASDFKRPALEVAATHIHKGTFELTASTGASAQVRLPLPGLYNIYNALAAAAAALTVDVSLEQSAVALGKARGVFGRFEKIHVANHELIFCLIKNPVGATEVMRTIAEEPGYFSLAFLANDHFADGLDVSWYWDSAFELLAGHEQTTYCGGLRAFDLAVRLKYAGLLEPSTVEQIIPTVLDTILAGNATRTYILCTYTATLEAQAWLTRHGYKAAYWEE